MPNTSIFVLLIHALCLLSVTTTVHSSVPVPAAPKISASSYLLIDYDSHRVLAEKGGDIRLEPASLTKIMTAYAVLREIKEGSIHLDDQVTVSEKAWRTPGSRMFIEVGKQVSVESLLKGMMIQSGNDASVALAEHVAGSEDVFAALMNRHAQRLGMTNTHFVNSTGLPDKDHYTTANDIAVVSAATIREFPNFYPWYAVKEFNFNDIQQYNRNKLLWRDSSVDGIKTGHTEAAGYCLVASAKRDGMRLISVVMGTTSENARAKESQSLLNYGFRFFETHRLYGGGDKLGQLRVWKGDQEMLQVGLPNDLFVTIPRGQYKKMQASMTLNPKVVAPVTTGDPVGSLTITLEDRPQKEVTLTALHDIAEGSLWRSVIDSILLLFQ